jgi:hypothetical protein
MSLFDLKIHGEARLAERVREFEASLPEDSRKEFRDLLFLALAAGEARVHEMWFENLKGGV